jgi:hypothetical protein
MSKIALSGNASGTGVFTLASPNSNSDRTLNLPDSAGTIATAESTLAQFNASGSAPVYACRAWVNFNGTGTVAIRASGNVSSITDNGTGDYTVNFTTAMPDANYATLVSGDQQGSGTINNAIGTFEASPAGTTSSVRVLSQRSNGAETDLLNISVAIFR